MTIEYQLLKILLIVRLSVNMDFIFPRYTSYLIKDNLDLNRLQQLENTLKCHCEIKHENYRYILKCYYRYELPRFIDFIYKPSDKICLGESYDGRFTINFKSYTHMIVGGTTGSGKSNLIASILLNLDCNKLYLDLKGRSRQSAIQLY